MPGVLYSETLSSPTILALENKTFFAAMQIIPTSTFGVKFVLLYPHSVIQEVDLSKDVFLFHNLLLPVKTVF